MIDYLDPDVAYLLGLIVARGIIQLEGTLKTIMIAFPYKNLEVEGINTVINQRDKLLISLDKIVDRIRELTDADVRKVEGESEVNLIIQTHKETMFIRNIRKLLRNRTNYYEFEIPPEIFEVESEDIKKEFMRGYADVAGSARKSNRDKQGRHRVYLDVLNRNWKLPIQICHLLQDHLGIPVNTIAYGHPNIRDPKLEEYNKGRRNAWAREHQIKIYADEFTKIGFYLEHKQRILEELADENKKRGFTRHNFCDPCKPVRYRLKPLHPEENSDLLPPEIRGKHFDNFRQICIALGCVRFKVCQGSLKIT